MEIMDTLQFTKVSNHTNKELLDKVKSLPSFKGIPQEFWILGVQSEQDTFNEFDDKFYIFYKENFYMVISGTTNAGSTGLENYKRYNSEGCAVIKTNEWYYDLWKFGYHHGKMPALKQCNPILYYRDWNKNKKAEELGTLHKGIIGINFHTVLYQKNLSFWRRFIGGWSTGCQVVNNVGDYYTILNKLKDQHYVSYCLIKDF